MSTKLQEAVLYVANRSEDDPWFGLTKLNKILFLADFGFFGRTGQAITGTIYVHEQHGPVAPELVRALDALQEDGAARVSTKKVGGYKQKRVFACRDATPGSLSPAECDYLDYAIQRLKLFNGTEAREWAHGLNPWLLTEPGEVIPYPLVFVFKTLPVEPAGLRWADQELERLRQNGLYAH